MLSAPPAIIKSPSSALIILAPAITASMPDAHNLFNVMPGTLSGKSASNNAILAIFLLSSPA